MRAVILSAFFFLSLTISATPLCAQSAPPTFLFLLEGRGVPTGTIHVFGVNSTTGALTEVPGSPFNAGLTPWSMSVDPTGRFLYVANQQTEDISGFSVDPVSGTLSQIPGSPFFIGSQPLDTAVDPTGRFLFVSATGQAGQGIFEYDIDANTGMLTEVPGSPQLGLFISAIAFHPSGNYAYLSTGSPSGGSINSILQCAISFDSGALTPVAGGSPASGGSNAAAISPGGDLLYSVDPVTSELDAFALGAGGLGMAETSGSPYTVPNLPYSLVVHPSGNFLYVVNTNQQYQPNLPPNQYSGSVSAYGIAPGSGVLTPISGSPFPAGINPLSVVVDPTGRFAYVTNTEYTSGFTGFAQILCFSIDPITGILTPLTGTPWTDSFPSNGSQLAISSGASLAINPVPSIASLSPASTTATATAFSLEVDGTNFVPGSTVYFEGLAHATTFVSSMVLTANILASDINNGGTAVVFVFNPLPGGGSSTSVGFPVFNPVPAITALGPSTVTAGTAGFSFAVSGTGFVTSSVVNFNGTPVQTLYLGPGLVVAIPSGLISDPGTAIVTVSNPSNGLAGGGTSNSLTMSIVPPVAPLSVTSISPLSATAGGPGFTLTVSGTGFVPASEVTFNLINVPTTFVSSNELTATISASLIAVAGNPLVIVNNPDGSTSISSLFHFTINNPQATVASITPQSLPVGTSALTLNVAGTGYVPSTPGVTGSQVFVNSSARRTTFVSSTQLTATLLPADLSQPGTLVITVANPLSAGSAPHPASFAVTDFSVDSPASIPPVTAGQPADISLTVSPTGGSFDTPVNFTASHLPPEVTATFLPSATITPGSAPQTVTLRISTAPHTSGVIVRIRNFPLSGAPMRWISTAMALLASLFLWAAPWPRMCFLPRFLLLLLLVAAAGMAACGAVGSSESIAPPINPATGTPAGSYTIEVQATSNGITHTAIVNLAVM